MYHVSTTYYALRLLKAGQTDKLASHLQTALHGSMQDIDLMAATLHRPDMLTYSLVVKARAFDASTAIEGRSMRSNKSPVSSVQDSRTRQDDIVTQLAAIDQAIIRWNEKLSVTHETARKSDLRESPESSYLDDLLGRRNGLQQELQAIEAHNSNSTTRTSGNE